MAEQPETTKVKVIRDFHQFSGVAEDGSYDMPTDRVLTYASLGVIEMPSGFDKAEAKKGAK